MNLISEERPQELLGEQGKQNTKDEGKKSELNVSC